MFYNNRSVTDVGQKWDEISMFTLLVTDLTVHAMYLRFSPCVNTVHHQNCQHFQETPFWWSCVLCIFVAAISRLSHTQNSCHIRAN